MKQLTKLLLIFIIMLVAHAATFCHPTCESGPTVMPHSLKVTDIEKTDASKTADADHWVLLTRFKY